MRIACGLTVVVGALAVGCAGASPPRTDPRPPRAYSAGSRRTAAARADSRIRVVELQEVPGVVPAAWAFVSTDLHQLGQPELILMVKRAPGEAADAYPSDAPEIVSSLADAVRKGRNLLPWQQVELPDGMLERADLTGIAAAPFAGDARVPEVSSALVLVLMTKGELEVAFHFGAPRVATLLGLRERFFPFPPWFDRARPSVCDPAEMKAALTGRIGRRAWLRDANAWQDMDATPERVVFRLSRPAGRQAARALREAGDRGPAFFPLAPAEDADARLVWKKSGEKPAAIARTEGHAHRMTGSFVALIGGEDADAGARVIEDGFALFVPGARWADFLIALDAGKGFEVPGSGGKSTFGLAWSNDSAEVAIAENPSPRQTPATERPAAEAAADVIDIPNGVRFKPAPAAVNEAARRKLLAGFAASRGDAFATLFGSFTVAGPGLWRWFLKTPGAGARGIPSWFIVPMEPGKLDGAQRLEGRMYKERSAVTGFARLLRTALPADATPKLRRPTRQEIGILWSLVPYDLEDPLYVVELGSRQLLVSLSKDLKITWIDDLAGASFQAGKGVVWSEGS